jgi:hypothetical protein
MYQVPVVSSTRIGEPEDCNFHVLATQVSTQDLYQRNRKLYPFLEDDDPKLRMSDTQILDEEVDLEKNSMLSPRDTIRLRQLLHKHRGVFSLRGETGSCNYEVKLDLIDDSPFYIRPYTVSEQEKRIIDKELTKLVKMGVLQQGTASSSSPVLLVNKKGPGNVKRVVSDLRFLNKRIRKRNWPFPLVRDTVQRLGASGCRYLSTLDLKDAFHSLKLHKDSQRHAGITSYYGGKSYFYKRLPQGASLSPCEFQQYIQSVLDTIPDSHQFVIAHMDDIIIYSESVEDHFFHIREILVALEENGLKISPKKAQLFKQSLTYMGHVISIKNGKPHIHAMKDKCEAIRRLRVPRNSKEVKSFVGAVNYLSMYLPNLQMLLAPLHKLSSPRTHFFWTAECQQNFDRIKELLAKPPVLAMPTSSGVVRLYTDTSRVATGATLCQVVDDEERIIAFHSKTLPPAAARYSVTELEFFGLYQNVQAFQNFLKGVHFEVYIDHSAVVQILSSKNQPPTRRMQTLIERLNPYSFVAGYKKGKDMVVCDLLSRMCEPEGEDPLGDPTPIACVVTRSMAQSSGITVPPVTGITMDFKSKGTRTSSRGKSTPPPTTPLPTLLKGPAFTSTPKVPSQREGSLNDPQSILDTSNGAQNIPDSNTVKPRDVLGSRPIRSPQRPNTLVELGQRVQRPLPIAGMVPRREPCTESDRDYEEVRRPVTNDILTRANEPLFTQVNMRKVNTQNMPKQVEIDKHLSEISKRCLRDFNVPLKQAELRREYRTSPYFSQVAEYLNTGMLPVGKKLARSVMRRAEEFISIQGVLFRILPQKDSDAFSLKLAVPESLAEYILSQHHDSLLACHQGVTRTYITLRRKFFIPNLYNRLVNYIKSCSICQQRRTQQDRDDGHQYQKRIFQTYKPFAEIHADIKHMFPAADGSLYLLVATCIQTRFVIAVPLKRMDSSSVAEALLQRVVFNYGIPDRIVSDQGKSFANKVLEFLLKTLQIESTYVSPENHGSLAAERSIQSISKLLLSQLEGHGTSWPLYVGATCYAYNTFSHSLLDGYSPWEMVYGRVPPDHTKISVGPTDSIPSTYAEYVDRLKIRFEAIGSTIIGLQNFEQEKRALKHEASKRKLNVYKPGQLVYFLMPSNSNLSTNTRKFVVSYIGPVKIKEVLDNNHVILEDLSGRLIAGIHHVKRLKPAFIRSSSGLITNESDLQRELKEAGNLNVCTNMEGESTGKDSSYHIFMGAVEKVRGMWSRPSETQISEDAQAMLAKSAEPRPIEGHEMLLTKSRYKDGHLEVHFSTDDKSWNDWYVVGDNPELMQSINEHQLARVSGSRSKLGKKIVYF